MLRSCKQTDLKKTLRWKKCFTDEYNFNSGKKMRKGSFVISYMFLNMYMLKKKRFIYRSLLLDKRETIEFVPYT